MDSKPMLYVRSLRILVRCGMHFRSTQMGPCNGFPNRLWNWWGLSQSSWWWQSQNYSLQSSLGTVHGRTYLCSVDSWHVPDGGWGILPVRCTKQTNPCEVGVRHAACTVPKCGFVVRYQNTSNLEQYYIRGGHDHAERNCRLVTTKESSPMMMTHTGNTSSLQW